MDTTLADALREVAATTPRRELVVDGPHAFDAATLQRQATTLANALLARMPVGSVVSFMLPNWHEAAVVYLGATLAGNGRQPDPALAPGSRSSGSSSTMSSRG